MIKSNFPNVQVLVANGELISLEGWQAMYGLPVGSDKIGKSFSLKEDRFQRDISEFGGLVVNAPLMMVMDEDRRLSGVPTIISSYNRNDAKQIALIKEEEEENIKLTPEELKKVHKLRASMSPHVFKMACDKDVKTREQVIAGVPILRQAAKKMNIPIRIGYKLYLDKSEQVERTGGQKNTWTFIHFDVCPLFYAKGMPFHYHPHPESWEREIEW